MAPALPYETARRARSPFSSTCATNEHEEALIGSMKFFKQIMIAVVASCVLAAGALAFEPQKNDNKPPPPKEKQQVPKTEKPPPPRSNDGGNRGNDNKKGKP